MSRKKAVAGGWNLRIIGHDRVPPSQLTANPFNHRRHPQKQRDAVAASIRDLGFLRSVTVNKTTGNLIDGHERVWQALSDGQPLIDVEYVELTEAEERLALAVLDKTTEMAEVDPEALDALLREIETCEAELQALLAEMANDAGLYQSGEGEDDGGTQEVPESYQILVECDGEAQQVSLLSRFQKEGIRCRSLIA
jgi:hypothetical protein